MMTDVYHCIAVISYSIFIIQFLISVLGGEIDVDFDLDGHDIITFKGLIHFLMGFSGYLCIVNKLEWYDYFIAIIIGIVFVFVLFLIYELVIKFKYEPSSEEGINLIGRKGTIYLVLDDYYIVTVVTNGISEEFKAYPTTDVKHSKGDEVTIVTFKDNCYFIN